MRPARRRASTVLLALIALVALMVVLAGSVPSTSVDGLAAPFDPKVITGFRTDGFDYRWSPTLGREGHPATAYWDGRPVDQGTVTVSDPAVDASGHNRRVVASVAGVRTSEDQGSCVTVLGPLDRYTQPGVALRIRTDAGRTRAITVTNNVVWLARQGFNVHLADSKATGVDKMHEIGAYIAKGFATSAYDLPLPPWRLCARVRGQQLSVKVWAPDRTSEPPYTDARYALSVQLPPDWVFAGKPGFYVGHLAPGASTALGIGGLEQVPG